MKETAPIIITFLTLISTAIFSVDNGRGFAIIASFPWQFILPGFVLAAAVAGFSIFRSING
jgi:hypothetical protein